MLFHGKEAGEDELLVIKTSRKVYILVYLMVLVVLGAVGYMIYNNLPLNTATIIVVILFLFFAIKYTEIHRMTHTWKVTPNNFVHISGLINKRVKKLEFHSISDVEVSQTSWQRLLNYGDVTLHQFAELVSCKNVNNPQKVVDTIQKAIELKRMNTLHKQGGKNG